MITNISDDSVYLDASFLIFWFISKEPELRKQARCIFTQLLIKKIDIFSSVLSFDEAWWGIKNEYNLQNNSELACSDSPLYEEIEKFTSTLLPKVKLLQFSDASEGLISALEYISLFKLKPRDACHLSVMKNNSIKSILTDDEDFIKNSKSMKIAVHQIL